MRQAFGFIDRIHIPILKPRESSQDFNCKGSNSVTVDFRDMFIDIDCRWPGSLNTKVFANSKFNTKMIDNKSPATSVATK